MKEVLITGGAGYIGSLLCGVLLEQGYRVKVLDDLFCGGESIIPYLTHPRFHFIKCNLIDKEVSRPHFAGVDLVVHLAAIVGFPACQQVGEKVAWLYNYKATQNVFELAEEYGVERLVFASTYSNYGLSQDGRPVTEDAPLFPQSLYAETKIASEKYLLEQVSHSHCAPIVLRFATLFGISPRTRFDLIINQFVLEARERRKLIIYQRGYHRSFVHVRDVVRAIQMVFEADIKKVRGEVFNVGSDNNNCSKNQIIELIQKWVPGVAVEYKDLTFGGDMRDIKVSFEKIRDVLGYTTQYTIEDGICEVYEAIESGLIKEPKSERYRNAQFIVQ